MMTPKEIWKKYGHEDELFSNRGWHYSRRWRLLDENFKDQIIFDLWQVIKSEIRKVDCPQSELKIETKEEIKHIEREQKVHYLKCKKQYFLDVISGVKTFEVRKNDKDFKVGDILVLQEIDIFPDYSGNSAKSYESFTGRQFMARIIYMFPLSVLKQFYPEFCPKWNLIAIYEFQKVIDNFVVLGIKRGEAL